MTRSSAPSNNLTVLICSGNLGNAKPSLTDISSWIPQDGKCSSVSLLPPQETWDPTTPKFDLIVVGVQEATWSVGGGINNDSTREGEGAESFDSNSNIGDEERSVVEAKAQKDVLELDGMIETTLSGGTNNSSSSSCPAYKLLAEKQRGQMRLMLWVRQEIVADFSNLKIQCENTGVARVLPNKGGIVISVTYQKNTTLSFLSAHLAAHEGDKFYKGRIKDLVEILAGTSSRYDITLTSHHVFVLGDLNFRTRFPQPTENSVQQALDLIGKGDFQTLYSYDELHRGIAQGELLADFSTLPCHFHPTFKVLRQAGFVYKNQRTPSYTDRILFKSLVPEYLQPLAYEPCPNFTTSDHKPIRGAFRIIPNAAINRKSLDNAQACSYTLKFHSMSCSDLPIMDVTGSSDPYIALTWDHVDIGTDFQSKGKMKWVKPESANFPKTKTIMRNLNPVFQGDEIVLSMNGPIPAEAILYLTVMDYDMAKQNDLIGTVPLSLRELVTIHLPHGETEKTLTWTKTLLRQGKQYGTISYSVDIAKHDKPLVLEREAKSGIFSKMANVISSRN